ncbi:MAG: tRNA pseudouridine(38-40) synthase TruA, partial [Gemmatimonadota bacterium]|nr:tRNA pseudouridine(38-40) synthase TruA [Gemmatimonadota bacterium]
ASPFRRRTEWKVGRTIDVSALHDAAALLAGEHCFRGFAVRGTAPAEDDHRCVIHDAVWRERGRTSGLVFEIEANRFLHHMVRFLVGTMMDVATGRRPAAELSALLTASSNDDVSPPAPAHGLFLDRVTYPDALYLSQE